MLLREAVNREQVPNHSANPNAEMPQRGGLQVPVRSFFPNREEANEEDDSDEFDNQSEDFH
jgi:hypothetical protein